MKRIILIVSIVILIALSFAGWRLLGPATAFSGDKYYLYIPTGSDFGDVVTLLKKDTVLKHLGSFTWLAARMDYPSAVKAGKYEIKSGMSVANILHILHNGHQSPVRFTITKLRTRENLAFQIGKRFEPDSAAVSQFCGNNDSLAQFGVDSNTFMTIVFPNTYTYFWNSSPSAIFKKMYAAYKTWWTPGRIQQARDKGLTPTTAYILASIVEEETNLQGDKGKIASVYLNRMAKGMRLAADPTVKFALRNFELRRIYDKYTKVESPYNTYRNAGLPPGPICTPSEQTLTAVLESPNTDYLYFVAKPDFSGYSNFSSTYAQHMEYAGEYRKALDEQMAIRAKGDSLKKLDTDSLAAKQ